MPLLQNDLSRRFFLDVTADGAVLIRERGTPLLSGALPTFTTDTYDQALMLQVRHCRRANDGSGIYRLNEPAGDLEALGDVCDMLRVSFEAMT
jgi:hypothetical protein